MRRQWLNVSLAQLVPLPRLRDVLPATTPAQCPAELRPARDHASPLYKPLHPSFIASHLLACETCLQYHTKLPTPLKSLDIQFCVRGPRATSRAYSITPNFQRLSNCLDIQFCVRGIPRATSRVYSITPNLLCLSNSIDIQFCVRGVPYAMSRDYSITLELFPIRSQSRLAIHQFFYHARPFYPLISSSPVIGRRRLNEPISNLPVKPCLDLKQRLPLARIFPAANQR